MHVYMHGPACPSSQTQIRPHQLKPHLNYMIQLLPFDPDSDQETNGDSDIEVFPVFNDPNEDVNPLSEITNGCNRLGYMHTQIMNLFMAGLTPNNALAAVGRVRALIASLSGIERGLLVLSSQ